jgi:hypothetical protein
MDHEGRTIARPVQPVTLAWHGSWNTSRWIVDGVRADRWRPSPGVHLVRATLDRQSDTVWIHFEEQVIRDGQLCE